MRWRVYAPGYQHGDSTGSVPLDLDPVFAAALALPDVPELDYMTGEPKVVRYPDPDYRGPKYRHPWVERQAFYSALELLDDMPATVAVDILRGAVDRMRGDPDTYRDMNPPNTWGSYELALAVLEKLLAACVEHPDGRIHVS
jgi:hypothetical protein